jgi:hypothetical protein
LRLDHLDGDLIRRLDHDGRHRHAVPVVVADAVEPHEGGPVGAVRAILL